MASKKLINAAAVFGSAAGTESGTDVPKAADFDASRVISGGANVDVAGKGVKISAPSTTSNTNALQYLVKTITAGPNGWQATAHIHRFTPQDSWAMMGMILRDSVSGKSKTMGMGADGTWGFIRNNFSSDTAWDAANGVCAYYNLDFWLRVVDDLTNQTWFLSPDGENWQKFYVEARAYYVLPKQVGVFINPNMGGAYAGLKGVEIGMVVKSFKLEQL